MPASNLIERIKKDLEAIWGEMAHHFVNKRMEDIGLSDRDEITYRDAEMIIKLLKDRTFPFFINKEVSLEKSRTYMRWVNEERPEATT